MYTCKTRESRNYKYLRINLQIFILIDPTFVEYKLNRKLTWRNRGVTRPTVEFGNQEMNRNVGRRGSSQYSAVIKAIDIGYHQGLYLI